MKVMINIPKEFENDFNANRFFDCFHRLICDVKTDIAQNNTGLAGNYEIETLRMLETAFTDAKVVTKDMEEEMELD